MKDERKTRAQLIEELEALRRRVGEPGPGRAGHEGREQAPRESEDRFRTLLEDCPVGVVQAATDGKTLYANRAICALLGIDHPDELDGGNWRSFFTTASVDTILRENRKRQEGLGSTYEVEAIGKDGTKRTLIVTGAPLLSKAGELESTIATLVDITERKRADELLHESEARYRELFDNANDIVYTHDVAGNFTSGNRATERTTGYTVEELLEWNALDIVAPEYHELVLDVINRKVAGEEPTRYELEIVAKDGRRVPLEVSTRVVYKDGRPVGIQGIARDITERRRAQAERLEAEDRFRAAMQDSLDGVGLVEGQTITFANQAALSMWGYESEDEVLGRAITDVLAPEYRGLVAKRAELRAKGEDVPSRYEFKALRKDSSEFPVELSASMVLYEGRMVLQTVFRDITQRKQTEDALRESEEKYRTILEGIQEGYYEVDLAGNFTFFNRSLRTMLGYSEEELTGMNFRQYMDRENARNVFQAFNQVYRTGTRTNAVDWALVGKDGTP